MTVGTIGLFFFIFGFVTWLNGILIPYLKISCELNHFESYLVAFAFYVAYVIMAIPSSWILKRTGLKSGMMYGLFVMAVGALFFVPAAMTRTYGMFLTGLFVMGTGLAILQTAANPYITLLGPIESAAQRISIMGICNKSAGIIATFLFGVMALSDGDALLASLRSMDDIQRATTLDELASRVVIPYLGMAIILVLIGIFVKKSGLPEIDPNGKNKEEDVKESGARSSIFQYPYLLLGVIAIFCDVGLEIVAGDTIISYGLSQGIPISIAKHFTSLVMIASIIGYTIGVIAIPRFISQSKALRTCAVLGIILTALAISTPETASVVFIALLGMANSLIWPSVWPLAIDGLGRFTRIGSSLLIMGNLGGALVPLLYGRLADVFNPQQAYLVLIPCYFFILYFAMHGHKLGKRTKPVPEPL
ncbi:MAG: glucose/galactose MFS transporter [Bacteroidetes bacterium GWE2_41_25]|nr:MAG: glucose/galactose MFS transporter [Bacteroidetes bacterium GWA2_40_15]OFX96165.1 MAG: glucose/galactose MFS transporter [Bacteroidetes bacterium GWE2_41_25]OFY01572.1 MAG: glucose/galactose MFS transporter [Bacteroidetes bacterium GWC2_40_22]OFY60618.1 MAG: glucose/galactose MFS transporter [Bacteroidetes bacterium GWF2_41_9]HAM09257.1 glucose/galactose MFS transporter [Bacteroidales bacterium]